MVKQKNFLHSREKKLILVKGSPHIGNQSHYQFKVIKYYLPKTKFNLFLNLYQVLIIVFSLKQPLNNKFKKIKHTVSKNPLRIGPHKTLKNKQ